MRKKTIIHVAPFAMWTLGKGKGMPSVYRPIKGLANNGYEYALNRGVSPDKITNDRQFMREQASITS